MRFTAAAKRLRGVQMLQISAHRLKFHPEKLTCTYHKADGSLQVPK